MRARIFALALLAGTSIGTAHHASAQQALAYPPGNAGQPVTPDAANPAISPFTITGIIERLTIDNPGDPLSPGKVVVNGNEIIIPSGSYIIMPAQQVTLQDLFLANYKNTSETGLALSDKSRLPGVTFEITIMGNVIRPVPGAGNPRWIAGLINISQEFLHAHQGYIVAIDYKNGELLVSNDVPAPIGANGAAAAPVLPGAVTGAPLAGVPVPPMRANSNVTRIKLNDPKGRYGRVMDPAGTNQSLAFAVDPDNPTIHAMTGYPMCIPRIDPALGVDKLCPVWNRPLSTGNSVSSPVAAAPNSIVPLPPRGQPLTKFVMDDFNEPPNVPGASPVAGVQDIPACGLVRSVQAGVNFAGTAPQTIQLGGGLNATDLASGVNDPVNNNLYMAGAVQHPCDPSQQAPFMVGDMVVYAGTLSDDGTAQSPRPFISAWMVQAMVGIFTKPCKYVDGTTGALLTVTDPVTGLPVPGTRAGTPAVVDPNNTACNLGSIISYQYQDDALVGMEGISADGILVEGQDRMRLRGFSTDPTRDVDIYAYVNHPGDGSDITLRGLARVVPERIPFSRWELFIQRDTCLRLRNICLQVNGKPGGVAPPPGDLAALPPIADNHQGIDFGAPRHFYSIITGAPAQRSARRRALRTAGGFVLRNKPLPGASPLPLNGLTLPAADPTGKCIDGTGPGAFDVNGLPIACQPTYANGLLAGQYWQPIGEYITVETIAFGDAPRPNNFECSDFLVYGQNVTTLFFSGTLPPLTPWPGGLTGPSNPGAPVCAPQLPPGAVPAG